MSSYTTELPKESDIEKITNKMESLIDSFDTLNMSIKKSADNGKTWSAGYVVYSGASPILIS